jgi:hypothetical protein
LAKVPPEGFSSGTDALAWLHAQDAKHRCELRWKYGLLALVCAVFSTTCFAVAWSDMRSRPGWGVVAVVSGLVNGFCAGVNLRNLVRVRE